MIQFNLKKIYKLSKERMYHHYILCQNRDGLLQIVVMIKNLKLANIIYKNIFENLVNDINEAINKVGNSRHNIHKIDLDYKSSRKI